MDGKRLLQQVCRHLCIQPVQWPTALIEKDKRLHGTTLQDSIEQTMEV